MTQDPWLANELGLLRGFVEVTDDIITVVDREGRFLYMNPTAERIFGLDREECVGRGAWEFVHPDDREATAVAFKSWRDSAGAASFRFENRQVSVEGRVYVMSWTVTRHEGDTGEVKCFVSIARDLTEQRLSQRALAESRSHLEAILTGSLDPIITINAHGIIAQATPSCLRVLGYEPDELIGENINMIMPEPHHSAHQGYVERYLATGQTAILGKTREFPVIRKDGREISVEISISRIELHDHEDPHFCGSFRDITEIKRARRRESAMVRGLAEIGESAALLAHEIKNPITAVNLALCAVASELGEDQQEVLQDLVERMCKLEKLMRRTLSLARPLELEPVECTIQQLLERAQVAMTPLLEEAGVRLQISIAPACPALQVDLESMGEALDNLIRNAIEAMPDGGDLRLEALAEQRHLVLYVDDSGKGLPAGFEDSLFKAYFTTKSSGTGLGLALVRKIVEAHGGSIDARHSPLGGARFEVRLPGASGEPMTSETPG